MPVASFEDFHASLCALMGAAAPLDQGEDGSLEFRIHSGQATAVFSSCEYEGQPAVQSSIELGVLPAAAELRLLRGLLEANFVMQGVFAPTFAREPQSGAITLHQSVLLSHVDAHRVHLGILNAERAVGDWLSECSGYVPSPHASAPAVFA